MESLEEAVTSRMEYLLNWPSGNPFSVSALPHVRVAIDKYLRLSPVYFAKMITVTSLQIPFERFGWKVPCKRSCHYIVLCKIN